MLIILTLIVVAVLPYQPHIPFLKDLPKIDWTWANSITLLIGMIGIIFTIYNIYDLDNKFNIGLKHSKTQLNEQLTHDTKEKSLLKFVDGIMNIINNPTGFNELTDYKFIEDYEKEW